MRKTLQRIELAFLLAAFAPPLTGARGAHVWEKQELTFTAARDYANPYTERLLGVTGELAGRSFFSLGFEEGDLAKTGELLRQVHLGSTWEGTLTTARPGEVRVFVQVQAVPMRDPSGAIDGAVLFAQQVAGRPGPRERDQIALLDRIGEQLSQSLELDLTLRHVAETLVPQLADHCIIDLFQGDKLIRRALISARDWTPPPGSWAQGVSRWPTRTGTSASRRWRCWMRWW